VVLSHLPARQHGRNPQSSFPPSSPANAGPQADPDHPDRSPSTHSIDAPPELG
jgi:hypothetical protein